MKFKQTILILCMLGSCAINVCGQDPDVVQKHGEDADGGWVFRTSDHDGEVPVNGFVRKRKLRVTEPAGGKRIGCMCMDGSQSKGHSSGACSGFGGVRFWIYALPNGDTVWVQTLRHELNPDTLNAIEKSRLNPRKKPMIAPLANTSLPGGGAAAIAPVVIQYPVPSSPTMELPVWIWPFALIIFGICILVAMRMLLLWMDKNNELLKDALSHFVRHKGRQNKRQDGKDPGQTRLP